jgi:hypothetical protein
MAWCRHSCMPCNSLLYKYSDKAPVTVWPVKGVWCCVLLIHLSVVAWKRKHELHSVVLCLLMHMRQQSGVSVFS